MNSFGTKVNCGSLSLRGCDWGTDCQTYNLTRSDTWLPNVGGQGPKLKSKEHLAEVERPKTAETKMDQLTDEIRPNT